MSRPSNFYNVDLHSGKMATFNGTSPLMFWVSEDHVSVFGMLWSPSNEYTDDANLFALYALYFHKNSYHINGETCGSANDAPSEYTVGLIIKFERFIRVT